MIGVASITWLITSGGVKIAEAINAINIAYFLLLASHSAVINPALINNNNIIGNWKHNPNAIINLITKDRYSEILGSISIGSVLNEEFISNDKKNSQARGITK